MSRLLDFFGQIGIIKEGKGKASSATFMHAW